MYWYREAARIRQHQLAHVLPRHAHDVGHVGQPNQIRRHLDQSRCRRGAAHIGHLGGLDAIAAEKAAIAEGLALIREVWGGMADGVTEAEFARRLAASEFALHWRAHGLGYGIPAAELAGVGTVLMNLSRAVLAKAMAHLPCLTVLLVTAPPQVLAARLAGRARETAADQARRLDRAGFALPDGIPFRTVLNDGTPEQGLARFLDALQPVRA